MINPIAKLLAPFLLTGVTASLAANPVHAFTLQSGFAGDYAPANWIFNANGGSGSVNTTGAPNSITIIGNNNNETNRNTDYTVNAAAGGPVAFSWSCGSSDSDNYDGFGYLLNGSFSFLANNATQGSGTATFNVAAGDTFGFLVYSTDGCCGPGVATISNFSAPAVPGPLPLLGAGAAFGWSRQLRKRLATNDGVKSTAVSKG